MDADAIAHAKLITPMSHPITSTTLLWNARVVVGIVKMNKYYTTEELCRSWGYGEKKVRALLRSLQRQGKLDIKAEMVKNITGQKYKLFKYKILKGADIND